MTVLWLDDRDGRYAGVLQEHPGAFDGIWGDIAPVEFACAAWRLATPPVADPGFVRWHRRILGVTCAVWSPRWSPDWADPRRAGGNDRPSRDAGKAK